MERDYVQRRGSSAPGRHGAPSRGGRNNRRKSGPPPLLYFALVLIIVIVAVVLIVVFAGRGGKEPEPGSGVTSDPSSALSSSPGLSSVPSSAPSSALSSQSATPPPEKIPSGTVEKLDTQVQIGDTGYEYYNFVQERAESYITAVCDAGTQLGGSATLYNMIIPTSMDIMLPESYIEENQINSQDQNKAINYMYSSINAINPDVKTVPIFDTLKLHNNDYIYFRTDHHWTQLGAYYAYVEFCKIKGVEAVPLEDFDKKSYEGFLGSFYSDLPSDAMANNPDTVEAYFPKANASLSYTDSSGETISDWPVIQDGSAYDPENLYLIFCAADQPYEEIVNSDLTDGSSCLVVKESFGNVFIPFLVNHYQTVYVVDYRHYEGDITDLAKEKGVSDVILLNNISMTRNEELIETLSNRF